MNHTTTTTNFKRYPNFHIEEAMGEYDSIGGSKILPRLCHLLKLMEGQKMKSDGIL